MNDSKVPGAPRFLDPAALMRIRSLELRARAVVEGFWRGLHRSPFHGFSVEFSEYRQYAQGDDPRYLDWKVLARSDRHFIKKYEDETSLRAHFFVDQSRSMTFGSGAVRKVDYANTLAASLGYFLSRQGDAIGLTTFHERIAEQLPPRSRPGHLRRFLAMLQREACGTGTGLERMLRQIPVLCRKRGLVVVVSDFLVPAGEIVSGLKSLRAAGHDVVLFRVLDPVEVTFAFDRAGHFLDVESGRELFVNPIAAGERYRQRFAEHEQAVRQAAQENRIEWVSLTTDRPLEEALWEFLTRRRRQRNAKTASRRTRKP
ncbi:MAG: Uncharacterized conserved protein, DUF58 family, contains vWF domain [Verrucomicrobia bacterium]|nr:MAG: Uncharacterized conserved protein, DUF58 family, contains vWF domain [Verrucomicrobiota bacterium]